VFFYLSRCGGASIINKQRSASRLHEQEGSQQRGEVEVDDGARTIEGGVTKLALASVYESVALGRG
jgi:hypothetical protein